MAVCALVGLNVALNTNTDKLSDIALASAAEPSSGEGNIHAGDVANKHCPIWDVTYTVGALWPSISCSTGGEYKCEAGPCPH